MVVTQRGEFKEIVDVFVCQRKKDEIHPLNNNSYFLVAFYCLSSGQIDIQLIHTF